MDRPDGGWMVVSLVSVLVACGPQVGVGDDGDAGSTGPHGDETSTGDVAAVEASTDVVGSEGSSGPDGSESGDASCDLDCNPGGVVLWQRRFGEVETWEIAGVAAVGSGGTLAVGGLVSGGGVWQPHDGFVLTFDEDGNSRSAALLEERVSGLGATADDAFVVTGDDDAQFLWAQSRDAVGNTLWEDVDDSGIAAYGGPVVTLANGEIVTAVGTDLAGLVAHYTAAGEQLSFAQTPVDVYITALAILDDDIIALGLDTTDGWWVARMDASGAIEWDASGLGRGTGLVITDDGNIAATMKGPSGYTELHRFAPDGTELLLTTIPQRDVTLYDMLALPGGDLVVAGSTQTSGVHCWIARMDPANAIVWEVSFVEETSDSECRAVEAGPDDTFYAAGAKTSLAGLDPEVDAWVMRIAP